VDLLQRVGTVRYQGTQYMFGVGNRFRGERPRRNVTYKRVSHVCARSPDALLNKRTRNEPVNRNPLARLSLTTIICSKQCEGLVTHDNCKSPSNLMRCPAGMLSS
jgi:hypothetical protein